MTIVEAMKDENIYNIRVSHADKWLVWYHGAWEVCYSPYGAKKTSVLITTLDEQKAVAVLLRDE